MASNILKTLGKFFTTLFPFLLSAVEREFNELPKEEKDALIQQGQFGQIIKLNLAKGYDEIIQAAATKLSLPAALLKTNLDELAQKYGFDKGPEYIDHLQEVVNRGLEDSAWDGLWTTVTGQLQIIAGGGKVSWPTIAIGITEFVYNKFIKGKI